MIQKTSESPIEELHRIRREISDRFGGDIDAIAVDAARRQAASGRPLWRRQINSRRPVIGAVNRERWQRKIVVRRGWFA
jgi:hypothetical protein